MHCLVLPTVSLLPVMYDEVQDQTSNGFDESRDDNPWMVGIFNDMNIEQVEETSVPENENHTDTTANDNQHCTSDIVNQPSPLFENVDSTRTDAQELLTEKDIESFLEDENDAGEGLNQVSVEEDAKPYLRQRFATREEGQNFFNFYSSVVGFSVAIVANYRTQSKKRNNEITKVVMKCNKHGKTVSVPREQLVPQRKSTVIAKSECKVEMRITEKSGGWEISRLNLDHNHELTPLSRFFRCHKYMSPEEKELIRTLKHTNTPTGKIVDILAYLRGGIGCLPYKKKWLVTTAH